MRCLFGFICVLALGVMGCGETSGTGGIGGSGASRETAAPKASAAGRQLQSRGCTERSGLTLCCLIELASMSTKTAPR